MKSKTREAARDILAKIQAELGADAQVDPLEGLLRAGASTTLSWDLRIDAWKAARKALYPDLTTTQITGKDDGPLQFQGFMAAILADPEKARAAELLSLSMNEQPRQLTAPFRSDPSENAGDKLGSPPATVPADDSAGV